MLDWSLPNDDIEEDDGGDHSSLNVIMDAK